VNSDLLTVINGHCLAELAKLPAESVQCCVTSPPYFGLRDYGHPDQIGQEKSPAEFVAKMVAVFTEVHRVLRADGTLWLNLGDSYAGSGRGPDTGSTTLQGSRANQAESRKSAHFHAGACGSGSIGRRWVPPPEGLKNKDLIGIPWRVAFALQSAGWYLRDDIIWHKPNPMPESVTDRPTRAHEYIFLLSKSPRYFYDAAAIAEPAIYGDNGSKFDGERDAAVHDGIGKTRRTTVARGGFNGKTNELEGREAFRAIKDTRNKRDVWTVPSQPYREAHFATFPPDLIKPCILAGSRGGDLVLDPFGGSGTAGMVALELGRRALLIELNPDYCRLICQRCAITPGLPLNAA